MTLKTNKKLSWCWQTRTARLEVSQGHQIEEDIDDIPGTICLYYLFYSNVWKQDSRTLTHL